ncbi:hypothetical protein ABZ671_04745 [Micromonospora sp. NPDC006766]|uniref:hypothetical protein n=1 Tax=Micromonospora sp. NPDC006766 TaxID=3154778 RepID=UPI0033DA6384
MSALRHVWRRSWCLLALVLMVGLAADPASAHPFGAPQQIEVTAVGDHGVRVRWVVGGTDDLTLLGLALGVFPKDRVMLDGAVAYEASDAVAMAEAPAFARYLTERITVAQDGRPCTGEVRMTADLAVDGADVLFTCPGPVGTVAVTSRMLTDLHEAYRTLARGPHGQKAVYDAAHESVDWTISGSRPASTQGAAAVSTGRSALQQLSVVGGVLLAAVAAGVLWRRRRGRRA